MNDDSLCPFCGEPEKVTLHYGSRDSYGQPIEPDEYENEGCANTNCPDSGLFCQECDEVLEPKGSDYYQCLNEGCQQWHKHDANGFVKTSKPLSSIEHAQAFFKELNAKHRALNNVV